MSCQIAVIKRYRETYPKDSIRNIASRTGIHYSRVGRLLNGSEMKLKEFEAFNFSMNTKGPGTDYTVKLFNECLLKLPKKRIQNITDLLEGHILNYQISHKSLVDNFKFIEMGDFS